MNALAMGAGTSSEGFLHLQSLSYPLGIVAEPNLDSFRGYPIRIRVW